VVLGSESAVVILDDTEAVFGSPQLTLVFASLSSMSHASEGVFWLYFVAQFCPCKYLSYLEESKRKRQCLCCHVGMAEP
jgi:hypothetical protein